MLHFKKDLKKDSKSLTPNLAVFTEDTNFPKNKLNEESIPAEVAYRLISDELIDEGNARQNLATFCQTYMEPEANKLMSECLAINAIDKSEYPKMTEVENYCVNILGDLWHAPSNGTTLGTSTVGSSEACMLGGLAMKFKWREEAEKAGIDINAKKPNLVISSGFQVCWEKFCVYWDIEMREVPLDEQHMSLNIDKVLDYVDDYTIGVVGILGITYTGKFDDIKALDKLIEEYNKTAKIKIGIHVDGASGAMFAPFVHPEIEWDFSLKNVRSISTSGHKYGLVYPGVGWVLWRDQEFLPKNLIFYVNYLGGEEPTMAINFSRSGSQIIGQYYIFMRYGMNGLKLVQQHTRDMAVSITREIEKMGIFEIYNDGDNVPVICYRLKNPENHKWSLYELADRLAMKGWQVPAYTLPANLQSTVIQRFVIRADFSAEMRDSLIQDLTMAIDYLEKNTHTDTAGKSMLGKQGFTH
ncbi:glutamate decarboxylase [Anaerorhabdus furcosa]|uniref:Glutamate decarboxylase n=1 Tax=Anaerorhabdus furcosa TaxID=118967 RepID=A0A1T4K1G5_9FIRM|nr:glutamate decarboxylase [Anaerorhabdus furcosa]SJZ36316.1 glutamate decarboxylase [Anaerorhabdus furcosa]